MSRPAVHCMASLIATSPCTMDYLANWSIPSLTHCYSHRLYWGGSFEFCNTKYQTILMWRIAKPELNDCSILAIYVGSTLIYPKILLYKVSGFLKICAKFFYEYGDFQINSRI